MICLVSQQDCEQEICSYHIQNISSTKQRLSVAEAEEQANTLLQVICTLQNIDI